MEKVKQYYENIAVTYDEYLGKWGYRGVIEDYLEHMNLKLKNNPTILDLGCGTGIAMNKLKQIYPDARIIGLDISKSMLSVCRKKMPQEFLVQGDYNNQEFFDFDTGKSHHFSFGFFDMIVSTGSLTEYGNLDKVLPFLYKLLKPEGYLVNIGHQSGIVNWIVMHFWEGKSTSKKSFRKKCLGVGFKSVHSIAMPFLKGILAWRKYGVVAQTPFHGIENIKLELTPDKQLETSFGR